MYKRGLNVRIDTTLIGFDERNWQRGNRSYIFKGQQDSATLIEIDHERQEVSVEQMKNVSSEIEGITPSKEAVTARLNAPITANNVDIDKISFERNKSGIWGWRSEKNETINNYDCKVFGASNVEFITRTRTEHMDEAQTRLKNARSPLQNFLGYAEEECGANISGPEVTITKDEEAGGLLEEACEEESQRPVTLDEYFSGDDLQGRDIGRPMKTNTKVQKFKATLWLSETFPIKLQEQVLPILDLMSTMASPHVSKLKDFITMQLPAGFPIKIGR